MTRKASLAFCSNCLSKMKDFSRLQADTYTVKVGVPKKWCEIGTLLLHTANEVSYGLSMRAISHDFE